MNNNKIKVVWICHFSNKKLNQRLPLKVRGFYEFISKLLKRNEITTEISDFGVWNINAYNEMKKYVDRVELHIIAPYPHLEHKVYEYVEDAIHFHFFKSNTSLMEKIINHFPVLYDIYKPTYKRNRTIIKYLIEKIQPSVVHLVGAENPYYSISALDIPHNIKLIVQLQTLMSEPKFFANYPIDKKSYNYRTAVEKVVIKRADFIGTTIQEYRNIILEKIKPNAKFLDLKLAVGEVIRKIEKEKEFDFVYFARYINKAGDWAVESFIEASKMKPRITMLVVGDYSQDEKERYEKSLAEYGLLENVTFTGVLPTHDDVLQSVAKARVALLPVKIDYIPGTIREANALGLPVVTSITDGTPLLNENRKCALLSAGGDHLSMARNMINVLEDSALAKELVENSYIRLQEAYDNNKIVKIWVEEYERISH